MECNISTPKAVRVSKHYHNIANRLKFDANQVLRTDLQLKSAKALKITKIQAYITTIYA